MSYPICYAYSMKNTTTKSISMEAYHAVLVPNKKNATFYIDDYPEHGALEAALEYISKFGGRVYRNADRVYNLNCEIEVDFS